MEKQNEASGEVVSTSRVIHKDTKHYYFDHLTVELPLGTIKIHVGDVVALECDESETDTTFEPWKDEPWSTAQILTLFQKKPVGEFKMEVRWFYRYKELGEGDHEILEGKLPEKPLLDSTVVELNTSEEYDIGAILGRVVLTSQREGFATFARKNLRKSWNPVPQVGLFCNAFLEPWEEGAKCMAIDDWGTDLFGVPHPGILRGLQCLKSRDLQEHLLHSFMDCFHLRELDQDASTFRKRQKPLSTITAQQVGKGKTKRSSHLGPTISEAPPNPKQRKSSRSVYSKNKKGKSQPRKAELIRLTPPSTTIKGKLAGESSGKLNVPKQNPASRKRKQSRTASPKQSRKVPRVSLDPEDLDDQESDLDEASASQVKTIMTPAIPTVFDESLLIRSEKLNANFYYSARIPIQTRKCSSKLKMPKNHTEDWQIRIGDIVCVERTATNVSHNHGTSKKELWDPFIVPWSCCQILNIYTSDGDVLIEARWFRRASGVEQDILDMLPVELEPNELFETFSVDTDIPASSILGRVSLLFAHHSEPGDNRADLEKRVPTAKRRRCRYLYYEGLKQIQPIFCRDTAPHKWFQRCRERGWKTSEFNKKDEDLKTTVASIYDPGIPVDLYEDFLQSEMRTSGNDKVLCLSNGPGNLLVHTSLTPPWHLYSNAEDTCHVEDRPYQSWKIRLLDIVAAKQDQAGESETCACKSVEKPWFPYSVRWSPCQIIAIQQSDEGIKFEVRWLYRSSDLSRRAPSTRTSGIEKFFELDSSETALLNSDVLLGPLVVKFSDQKTELEEPPPFLPFSCYHYGGLYSSQGAPIATPATLAAMSKRSIKKSKLYLGCANHQELFTILLHHDDEGAMTETSPLPSSTGNPYEQSSVQSQNFTDVGTTIRKFVDENSSNMLALLPSSCSPTPLKKDRMRGEMTYIESLLSGENRISTVGKPIHRDKSALKLYFHEMKIEPPLDHYLTPRSAKTEDWKVKVGDIVVLHYEHGAGKTFFDINSCPNSAHAPFRVPFAVAEVVAIWKTYDTKRSFTDALKPFSETEHVLHGDLDLEIRWFWRRCELPGIAKPSASSKEAPSVYEEIFETDHIDSCTATSLLAPAEVQTSFGHRLRPLYRCGMPVVRFICKRFWSYHRRSIVPYASSEGRLARSRMYSACMTKDDVLKMKLDSLHDGTEVQWEGRKATDFAQKLPWKDAFCTVIDKLTLTQASMDAFGENVALIGRSREQQEITTFLRAAIKGAHKFNPDDDDSKHPSMFVAGPPGTGKTVSVCSIIAKLRHEQIRGALPDFDFFSLNGMEMRHPFEAYVRFWEAISGHAKERASPEMAASKLERYFSGQQVKGVPRRQAVVLMLDEIDYLVTRKQTVLYNFFDWPKRSFETADSPRLIVIGISNTVNLPSQMKPSVRSRLGSSRCGFKAYDVQDIVDILTTKIQPDTSSYQVFEKDAIIFAARKIAATTGDIRKALQSCKAAVEAVMQEVEVGTRSDPKAPKDRPMVRIKDIQRVSQEKVGSVMSHAIASAAPLEALVLVSLAALSRHSGRETGGFDIIEVMTKTQAVANASGNSEYTPAPAFHEMLEILGRLAESRLVTLKTEKSSSITFRSSQGGSGGAWPIIGLIVDDCDIISAFRNGPHAQLAEKQLMSAFII